MLKPFKFHPNADGLTLEAAVFQALGAASVCWDSMEGTGNFHAERVLEIGEALIKVIKNEVSSGSQV